MQTWIGTRRSLTHLTVQTCTWDRIIEVRLRKSRRANLCSYNQFFRENVVVIAFSELRPGSNERYENSAFYGPFRFLIFILIFKKHTNLYISVVNTDRPFHEFFL